MKTPAFADALVVRAQWDADDVVGARHRHVKYVFGLVEHQAIRPRKPLDQQIEFAGAAQPEDTAGRIFEGALPLVREEKIAISGEGQVVQALETLAKRLVEHDGHLCRFGIERQQTQAVVGDKYAAIAMDLQAIRLAVIVGKDFPFALRGNLEYPRMRNVDAEEVSVPIE